MISQYKLCNYCYAGLSADGVNEVGVITRKWFGFVKSLSIGLEAQHTFVVTYKYSLTISDCIDYSQD